MSIESKIQTNFSLKTFNTFGIDTTCAYFVDCNNLNEIIDSIIFSKKNNLPILTLGGGSNILFTKKFDGVVLKNNLKGIEILYTTEESIYVKAGAGENWHQFVLHAVNNGWSGIENLSLIPGTVGASPIQNIGAYGVEVKDTIEEVEVLFIDTLEVKKYTNKECKFGYRSSIFKSELKNKCILLNVTFKLSKLSQLNLSYGAIKETLITNNITVPTIKDVSNAVIAIRESKLPNPKEIGNAGSFFKNPDISNELFEKLIKEYPSIPHYNSPISNHTKIAAGWLIEQCGWKGYRIDDIGVHKNQALVLVNYGNGKGNDLLNLCKQIIQSVFEKFEIKLEAEVNII
jgi:UDP-N-acetylmuramate dehydrogenase